MKVSELITRLQAFDSDLPVAIRDWNEDYAEPAEVAVALLESTYQCLQTGLVVAQSCVVLDTAI